MILPPPYKHQEQTAKFLKANDRVFDMSDPGTGKTRAHLIDLSYRRLNGGGKSLVLAPKSILQAAWGADIERFTPNLRYIIAYASNRAKAFDTDADVYITNHDAVNWLLKNPTVLDGFDNITVDESTAFKHHSSNRSKALAKLIKHFPIRRLLSGTPNPNTILDLWHQMLLLDSGERLGASYWKFRATCCSPVQVGPGAAMVKWIDKPGIEDAIGLLVSDITIRHKFEECIDIPPNVTRRITLPLSPSHRRLYEQLRQSAILELGEARVLPVNAAALRTKLLQLASGAVYTPIQDECADVPTGNGAVGGTSSCDAYESIATGRYELVAELVAERTASVCAFNWRHQRDGIADALTVRNIAFAVIDGDTPERDRPNIVEAFQAGDLQCILAHPQSAGHGLTLTRGVATIWPSPTDNAEYFEQFNRRIYRASQTQPTETILVQGEDTLDAPVYDALLSKLVKMHDLLTLLQE